MVLQGQGSCQHVGEMLHSVPHKILPHGQNQCPKGENFELLADFNGNYPRGVAEVAGLHPGMPAPRDSKLARAPKLLRWVNTDVKRAHRYRCYRSFPLPHHRWSYGSHRENGVESKLGVGKITKTTKRHAHHEGGGHACHKNGPINEEVGRACPRKRSNEGPHPGHRFAYDMRSLSQCWTFKNDCPETREDAAYINNGF